MRTFPEINAEMLAAAKEGREPQKLSPEEDQLVKEHMAAWYKKRDAEVAAMSPSERAECWALNMMDYVPSYMRLAKTPEDEIELWAPKLIIDIIKKCIRIDFDETNFLALAEEDLKFSRQFREEREKNARD